ncbi:hypothetical protein C2E23DRAFT_912171 [Lenzites betulinus]|nr:hypothetical protein C2E23DRAFT_912171 [Lenzites betulinus]
MSSTRKQGLSQSLSDLGRVIRRRVTGFVPSLAGRLGGEQQNTDKENVPVLPVVPRAQSMAPESSRAAASTTPSGSPPPGHLAALVQLHVSSTFSEVTTPTWSPSPSPSPSPVTRTLLRSHSVNSFLSRFSIDSETDLACARSAFRPVTAAVVEGSISESEDESGSRPGSPVLPVEDSLATPSGEPSAEQSQRQARPWCGPPLVLEAQLAIDDLHALLHPRDKSGKRRVVFKGGDILHERMEMMRLMLWHYTHGTGWIESSELVAEMHDKGPYFAKRLRTWVRAFIADRHDLPISFSNTWNRSALENEDLELAVMEHLQSVGKYVRAMDIVEFLSDPAVQQQFGLNDTIALSTAQGWMHELGYRWKKVSNGQYVDGHEREEVVKYRQDFYLPALNSLCPRLHHLAAPHVSTYGPRQGHVRILWHDESIFYAHDRRTVRWVHNREKSVPRAKGEGASLMVSDLFCAEDSWVESEDGKKKARRLFKPGKNR